MAYDNEKLDILKQQVERKDHLQDSIRSLNRERYEVRKNVLKLKDIMDNAQNNVDLLEKRSFSNLFYSITGKLAAKLEKVRAEARIAKENHNTAAKQLASIDADIESSQNEFATLKDCERNYKLAFDEKVEAIKKSDTPGTEKIRNLANELATLHKQLTELKAAITAGDNARMTADYIISLQSQADGLSVDALLRTNVIGKLDSMVDRHDRLKEAKNQIGKLQNQLLQFKNKLIGVSAFAKDYADISIFSRFIDWVFSNQNKDTSFYAESYVRQIKSVLNVLDNIMDKVDDKNTQIKAEFDALVLKIRL